MSSSPTPSRWPRRIVRTVTFLLVCGGIGWGGWLGWKQLSPTLLGSKRKEAIPTVKTRTATIADERAGYLLLHAG